MEEGDCQWNLTCIILYLRYLVMSHNGLRKECVAIRIQVYLVTETMGRKFIFI